MGVELGEPVEAAVEVGEEGGGGGCAPGGEVVDLRLEPVIGRAVQVQVLVDGDAGDGLVLVGGLGAGLVGVGG